MRKLPRTILVLLITLTCVGCDQATKFVAKRYLQPDAIISLAGDTLRLQYAENSGAFLSLGSSLPDPWRHLVFTVLVGIFLLDRKSTRLNSQSPTNLVCRLLLE